VHAFEFDPIADLLPIGLFSGSRSNIPIRASKDARACRRACLSAVGICLNWHNVSEIAGITGRKILMNSKPTILVIASSVDSFTLKDGRKEHTGYYLNELDVPVQAALDAGYQMVLATPEGNKPLMDPQSTVAAHFGAVKWPPKGTRLRQHPPRDAEPAFIPFGD
jgi:hypothetical protein